MAFLLVNRIIVLKKNSGVEPTGSEASGGFGGGDGAVSDGGGGCGGGGGVNGAALDGGGRSSSSSELGGGGGARGGAAPGVLAGGGQAVGPNAAAAVRRRRRAGDVRFAAGTDYGPRGRDCGQQLAADAPGGPWSRRRRAARVTPRASGTVPRRPSRVRTNEGGGDIGP